MLLVKPLVPLAEVLVRVAEVLVPLAEVPVPGLLLPGSAALLGSIHAVILPKNSSSEMYKNEDPFALGPVWRNLTY